MMQEKEIISQELHGLKDYNKRFCVTTLIVKVFEMLVWNNLSIHEKKIVLYNFEGFYNPLVEMIQKMESEGFLYEKPRYRFTICNNREELTAIFS